MILTNGNASLSLRKSFKPYLNKAGDSWVKEIKSTVALIRIVARFTLQRAQGFRKRPVVLVDRTAPIACALQIKVWTHGIDDTAISSPIIAGIHRTRAANAVLFSKHHRRICERGSNI